MFSGNALVRLPSEVAAEGSMVVAFSPEASPGSPDLQVWDRWLSELDSTEGTNWLFARDMPFLPSHLAG